MNTVLLISDLLPELNQALLQQDTAKISYCFFYAEGVQHAVQKDNDLWTDWAEQQHLTLSCCRTGLLRRKLLQEQESLTKPWQLASLTEFYEAISHCDRLIQIKDKKQVVLPINFNKTHTPRLLFTLNSQSKVRFPEEVLEFIIAASLYFETHVYCSTFPKMLSQKHLSALPLYEVQLQLAPPSREQKFDLVLEL